jgi:capsular polysaccharide biosynthesis protein
VRPENLELADQIAMFEQAPVVVGTVGSALHTALFSRRPGKVMATITWDRGFENYLLVDAAKQQQSHYVRGLTNPDPDGNFVLDVAGSLRFLEEAGLIPSTSQVSGASSTSL